MSLEDKLRIQQYMDKIRKNIPKEAVPSLLKSCRRFAKKISPVYYLLDWKWAGQTGLYTPDEDKLYETLIHLVSDLVPLDGTDHYTETGGLCVTLNCSDDGHQWFDFTMKINDENMSHEFKPKKVIRKHRFIRLE